MKKYLKILLVLILGFSAGIAGSFTYSLISSRNNTVTPETTSTSEIKNVIYSTVESSDLKTGIQKAYTTVVEISATTITTYFYSQENTSTSLGSGVIISADGYIITNDHVISGASAISVTLSDGTTYDATLVGTDSKTDIAVIKIDATNLSYADIADSDLVELGDEALVIGNPLGEGISVSNGIISALNKEVTISNETMYLFQTNAAVNQGNSGGGLFNIKGELIGIVNAKSSSSGYSVTVEGLGYAIPSNTVMSIASDLMVNGYVKNRATLGVKVSNVTQQSDMFEVGLYIAEVIEGSAAQKAGLQKYDRIVSIDGSEITSYTELSAILMKHEVGDTITVGVVRNNQNLEFQVTLQDNSN